jgi:acyl carrier protein
LSVSDLSDQARFVEDLKATSLDIVEMIMTVKSRAIVTP